MKVSFIIFLLFIDAHFCAAQGLNGVLKTIRPDFIQGQFAGNMGMVSGGFGYRFFKQKLNIALIDGYTPRRNHTGSINTYNLRATCDVATIFWGRKYAVIPYLGITCMVEETGHGLFRGRGYPEGYYETTSVHALLFAGIKYRLPVKGWESNLGLYAETGTLDTYAYFVIRNSGRHFNEIFSAALGAQYYFPLKHKHE